MTENGGRETNGRIFSVHSCWRLIGRGVDPYGTGGTRPPIFGLGDMITNVPPIFLE